tara:strand:- start:165 stop:785 length:621 start_codon:yes stop_codon:yes gene_type:complete
MEKITGCILVGGQSLRMGGGIKSLKQINNESILERVINRSKTQVKYLSINSNSDEKKLIKFLLPIFSDVIKGFLGPLAGIHAALNWAKKNNPQHEWVATFAGDTPFFPNDIVKRLYEEAIKKNKKIIIPKSGGRNHPVFGLWHISLEDDLAISLKKNNARKIDHWAKKYFFGTVDFKYKNYDPFFNINTPEDLIKAEEIENQFLEK